jgi:hypothetical protein
MTGLKDFTRPGAAHPRTAWNRDGGGHFRLVNKRSGRCLAAGEHYNPERFSGTGVWTVRTAPCATAGTWSFTTFSDKITRLVNGETKGSMGVGNVDPKTHDPTTFVLYMAYTNDGEQRFTLG